MNKKLLMSVFSMCVLISVGNNCNAQETSTLPINADAQPPVEKTIGKVPSPNDKVVGHRHHPSKEEIQAKKLEMEKRLNLTENQKKKIEENRKKDHEKIKPIMQEIRDKKIQMRQIDSNADMTQADKVKQKSKLRSDLKKLKEKADKCRQENMKNFENVLNPEQKIEFAKIKEERKLEMEQRRQSFEKIKKMRDKGMIGKPVEPKPLPETK